MLPEGVDSQLCLCPAPALAPPSPQGWKRRGSRWGEKGEGVREGKAPVPGDGLNLEEKASWRKKVTTRNSRKRMKCDRKVGLREITAAKNKHPKPAMGERKRSVNQKKWGCITALRPVLLGPGWGEPGGLGLGLWQGQDQGVRAGMLPGAGEEELRALPPRTDRGMEHAAWGQALPRTEHWCRRMGARCGEEPHGNARACLGEISPRACWAVHRDQLTRPTPHCCHVSPHSPQRLSRPPQLGRGTGLTPQSSLPMRAGEPVSVITFPCFLPNSSTESLFAIHLPWDFIGI